jgi:hypothetical protein
MNAMTRSFDAVITACNGVITWTNGSTRLVNAFHTSTTAPLGSSRELRRPMSSFARSVRAHRDSIAAIDT